MLTSLIRVPDEPASSAEDIFSSSLDLLFSDNLRHCHGEPGSHVIYLSKRFGNIGLSLFDPRAQEERLLFAHHVWNSGILLAQLISQLAHTDKENWNVEWESVLELGAGTGLVGIVSLLAGAREVVISDYPVPSILENIRLNVERNVAKEIWEKVKVEGHEWGVLTDEVSNTYASHFTRILCADCLWMDGEHFSLAQTMVHFLSYKVDARVWVLAGFHTGRTKLASFFDVAAAAGLEIEKIWERDGDGNDRAWTTEPKEGPKDVTERNKWLVVAVLKRNHSLNVERASLAVSS